ncbi:MAG: guanine nucleotide exchange protein for ADP-robosylation factor [Candelina submexicana]|nr:MAG: guanine nucleotide exchange protein for ADP-robosylation factor [Candelina submexicana]
MASVEQQSLKAQDGTPPQHHRPNGLVVDKEGLKSGQDWMEIRMEDAHSQDAEEQGYSHHANGFESPTSSRQEDQAEEVDGKHPETTERAATETPTISIQDADQPADDNPQSSPLVVDGGSISQSGPRPPERRSSKQFSSGSTSPLPTTRSRSDTQSTAATNTTQRPTLTSMVFVTTALENIAASKDAKKRKQLGDSVQRALEAVKQGEPPSPESLFEPLQLASQSTNIALVTSSLDCIGKLISYSYFSIPPQEGTHLASSDPQLPLIERAIETICDCFQGEATANEVQLQIVGSLLAAVLNDKIVVHGAGLLKAVRQIYNIFLLSKSSANQQVAQGTLAQMVGTVFERVKTRISMKDARWNPSKPSLGQVTEDPSQMNLEGRVSTEERVDSNGDGDTETPPEEAVVAAPRMPKHTDSAEKITLQSFENRKSFDDTRINDNAPTTVTHVKSGRKDSQATSGRKASSNGSHREGTGNDFSEEDEFDEIYIKDAFLVFRAMCKLSTKTLPAEQVQDLKSPGMRSKLLSLHLIHAILNNNMAVITSPLATIRSSSGNEPTSFVQAIKQYLCLSLSRNGASHANRVFEVSCEIFWLMLKNMRVMLKKEIEVFLKEIYLAILDKRTAPVAQKQYLMGVFERLCADPRALVEIYLNYDCDRSALDNMFQRIIEHLSRMSTIVISTTNLQQQQYQDHIQRTSSTGSEWHGRGTLPPSLSTASITTTQDPDLSFPPEYALKRQSLNCLVETLRSLVNWSQQGIADATARLQEPESRNSIEDSRESLDTSSATNVSSPKLPSVDTSSGPTTPQLEDDPSQLEKAKHRKTALTDGIRQFNFKPKRGIKLLVTEGFIRSDSPEDIATFLLQNDRLDKAMIGEYLGEGEPHNIATMHAFVDSMDFRRRRFVDALRQFLQSFRLPGEAQKIDRFMLKFAERYITGNPNAFANADTAYVLAYSVILLNTDQHSVKLKGARMTKEDFIKNNRGINDNADLPDDYLGSIYDEIAHNEIVLNTERENAAALGITAQPNSGLAKNIGQAFATVGRDLQREAYALASEEMANKTEQLFRSLVRAQRRNPSKPSLSKFIPATSFRHVGPMFDVTWMSFLSGLSGEIQNTQNIETIKLCMEGLKLAIRISCLFDLKTPRQAFVSALAKSTNLSKLSEMMTKNLEALKVLLEVAQTEGNLLKSSWGDVLACISQLDRFQLISTGVDEGVVPDMAKARIQQPHNADSSAPRKSLQAGRRPRAKMTASNTNYRDDVAQESRSSDVVKSVDRIFTSTADLSGDAIVHFVRALSEVSWQEIQSSGQSESPRTYSLQKLVEISYYNMTRVRFEWTHIWQVLGEHFNRVGCHTNTNVVFFALDSLRQLSMRFMEIEELPGFKFQKDFLKPFEHVMANSGVHTVKDMVLRCLIQMIQARGQNIRSGWKTMFGVFTVAAREQYESIVSLAFDNVNQIYNTRFDVVISQGAFADLVVCLTEFSKNSRFQKKSLQAIETLKCTIPKMLKTPECPLSNLNPSNATESNNATLKQLSRQSQEEQYWFPVLFAFHDVLMTGDDLEVRSRALGYLFDTLIKYGGDFPAEFWDILWRQLLYPIFMVLKSKSEMSKVLNHEELSVWLSSTMVQALRNMITLFTHYFSSLEYMLDRFLDLLTLCICQENDTIARIGSNCLQQLILQNVTKFEPDHWTKIVGAFVELFERTTAYQLFSAATSSSSSSLTNGGTTPRTPGPDAGSVTGLQLSGTPVEEEPPKIGFDDSLKIKGLPTPNESSFGAEEPDRSLPDESSSALRSNSPPNNRMPGTPSELEDYRPQSGIQQQPVVVTAARRRFFNKIITRCVLQLLMIETVNELFSNDAVYAQIPSPELLRLMGLLKKSFMFAKKFNGDKDLRMRLWREGFMKQPPNLLKQESGSAATYISILLRMYHDEGEERKRNRVDTESALIPLCADIIRGYTLLDEETQQRNIVAWRPVVVDVMEGYTNFPRDGFDQHINTFYPLAVDLLNRELSLDVRVALQSLLRRIGEIRMDMPPGPPTPMSPTPTTSSFPFGSRRTSRGR